MPLSTRTTRLPPTRVFLPRASTSGVDIPSSTVISIGLGFVAFAISVVFALIGLRMIRVMRYARRERAAGRDVTFRSQWREEGGFFGFLTGLGSESYGGGGGGLPDITMIRRMIEERERERSEAVPVPLFCEVEVLGREKALEEVESVGHFKPLCTASSLPPPYTDRAKPPDLLAKPILYVSVLIKLPFESPAREQIPKLSEDHEAKENLPDLVIGSTTLVPVVRPITAADSIVSTGSADKLGMESEDQKSLGQVDMVEDVGKGRTAQWLKADAGRWRIEGLG